MHPLIINESAHTYYQHPQNYVTKGYDTVRSASPYIQPTPSSSQPRRASMATTLRQRSSTKSVRDRRKSSGTLSSHHHHHQQNQHQKPRKYIGDYYVGKTLGKGASGRVKLGIHKHTGEQVAIKIISKAHLAANPAIEKAVRREIAIMKLIRHPNVMALVDVIDDANSSDINLILEHVQGGELFEYLVSKGRLTDSEARRHFQQIILGLDFCHHHLICHRDLKPENLLLDHKNNIKIADFGMASLQPSGSMLETSCGSPHYASPEIVAGTPYNGSASDIWSCGVILYALLTGHLPFDDENIRQLLKKVKAGKYAMPDDISRSAQDLIRRILVVDPLKRLSMEQIMAHPWFCESEPVNLTKLPIPPTANEIGRPVSGASDIDDRILETIKFLWGETQDETIVRALVSKEHNMQKVVYVLLQQHSERYWQKDHDDEDLRDSDRHYQTIGYRSERNRRCMSMVDGSVKKSTATRPSVPWMPEPVLCAPSTQSNSSTASSSGTMAANASIRRYSATTSSRADRSYPEFMLSPPLPPMPLMTMDHHAKSQIKKSETFYSRFIKNVLTSRRQSKGSPDSSSFDPDVSTKTASAASDTSGHHYSTMKTTLAGTLRRKNPFGKPAHQDTNSGDDKAACDPLKSMRRKSSISRNKIEAKTQDDIFLATSSDIIIDSSNNSTGTCRLNNGKPSSKTLNTKRLSIRVPNAFRNEKGTHRFGFTLNGTRRQRKELDMSLFHTQNQTSSISSKNNEAQYSDLTPPPALSDGSTLSNTSISTSNTRDNHHQHGTNNNTGNSTSNHSSTNDVHSSASSSSASSSSYSPVTPTTTHQQAYQFKTALRSSPGKGEFLQSPPPPPPPPQASSSCSTSSAAGGSPRESQVSLQSMVDRRGSNINTMNRPITPSLLSNNSTITTASGSYIYSPSQAMGSPGSTSSIKAEAGENKSSWLSNLFFFKQPKVCSVVIPETDVGTILCTLHRLINQTVEAKLYEKDDKQGIKRYKAEIKTTHPGKARQVKCRLEIMPSNIDSSSRLVQFTQQQGDGAVMTSVVQHLQQLLDQEYPTASSAITAGF